METNLQICKDILLENDTYTCVVKKGETILHSEARGIAPLLGWLETDKNVLHGAYIADKVIGKAAAMLMVYGGAVQVYAAVISEPAADCFEKNGIAYTYDRKVDHIVNRAGDGMCPMEQCCLMIDSPEEAYRALKQKLADMKKKA